MSLRNSWEQCRIGSCRAQVERSIFFCEDHAHLRPLSRALFSPENPRGLFSAPDPLTAVYVIGCRKTGAVKIGIAQSVISRIKQLQTGFPHPLKLYGAFYTKRLWAELIERACHDTLKDAGSHMTGEWFTAEPDDAVGLVTAISKLIERPVLTAGEYGTMLAIWDDLEHDIPDNLRPVRRKIKSDWLSEVVDKSRECDKTRL